MYVVPLNHDLPMIGGEDEKNEENSNLKDLLLANDIAEKKRSTCKFDV